MRVVLRMSMQRLPLFVVPPHFAFPLTNLMVPFVIFIFFLRNCFAVGRLMHTSVVPLSYVVHVIPDREGGEIELDPFF